jgi:hypothetical protein
MSSQSLERYISADARGKNDLVRKRWSADFDRNAALLPGIESVVSDWDLRLSPAVARKAESDPIPAPFRLPA